MMRQGFAHLIGMPHLLSAALDSWPRGKKPRKNYVGRTNRNGTVVTRALQGTLAPEFDEATLRRRARRAEHWIAANPDKRLSDAPRHIREGA